MSVMNKCLYIVVDLICLGVVIILVTLMNIEWIHITQQVLSSENRKVDNEIKYKKKFVCQNECLSEVNKRYNSLWEAEIFEKGSFSY